MPAWLAVQLEYLLRLLLSALFGGIIGLEREFRLKEAGIRTHLIVSFASCLMMLVSKYGFLDMLHYDSVGLDPSRVAAGIVTGIGFLGAGMIFARGRGVTGLTTAAGVWATLGIGMAVGAGLYLISAFCTLFIVSIQTLLHRNFSFLSHSGAVISVQLEPRTDALDRLNNALSERGLIPSSFKFERGGQGLSVDLELDRLPCSRKDLPQLLAPLMRESYIRSIQW